MVTKMLNEDGTYNVRIETGERSHANIIYENVRPYMTTFFEEVVPAIEGFDNMTYEEATAAIAKKAREEATRQSLFLFRRDDVARRANGTFRRQRGDA